MTQQSASLASVRDLVSARRHAADFTASRTRLIATRVRALALALAVLLPAWIPVDYLLLAREDFLPLAAARIIAALLALGLYFIDPEQPRRKATLGRLSLLVTLPASLYLMARLQLNGAADGLLYGYAFFPVLIAAMLAVFPLTLLEGVGFALPIAMGYGLLEFALGEPAEPAWLEMLWLLSLIALIALWTQLSQLRMLLDLFHRATRDPLTGTLNRRSLNDALAAEHARWLRHARPLSVIRVELTDWERITDQHGTNFGNGLLVQLTHVIQRALRPTDLLGRWDGATLLMVLPETEADVAERLAARLEELAEFASIPTRSGAMLRGSTRISVATPAADESLATLLQRLEQRPFRSRRPRSHTV